jgi:60 kDa SS-A/Ro ribonucleoprotein
MKTNTAARTTATTHEGAKAGPQTAFAELRRAVSTCLLFEDTFYETGSSIAARVTELCAKVRPEELAALAVEARTSMHLRHVPLYLVRQLVRLHPGSRLAGDTLAAVIRRPDECSEFLSLYWQEKRQPLAAQVKRGLAFAFQRFSEYQLAKWNRDSKVKLRDALFLCHAKPKDEAQAALWKQLVDGTLAAPDTWEVALSSGADKKATWERLLAGKLLGYSALLQNLRNMEQAGVDRSIARVALVAGAPHAKVLPYRYIAAAKAAPAYEPALEQAMLASLGAMPKLPGRTALVVDVSGSMGGALGGKSTLDRIDAACGLAMLVREVCEDVEIYATGGCDHRQQHATAALPPRRGFALRDAIHHAPCQLGGGGIFLKQCMDWIADKLRTLGEQPFARVIVFTDEQDCDHKANPATARRLGTHNYIINVAPYKPSIDTSAGWRRISGFSERVVEWIAIEEGVDTQAQAVDSDDESGGSANGDAPAL